jgi:hypothetical protein
MEVGILYAKSEIRRRDEMAQKHRNEDHPERRRDDPDRQRRARLSFSRHPGRKSQSFDPPDRLAAQRDDQEIDPERHAREPEGSRLQDHGDDRAAGGDRKSPCLQLRGEDPLLQRQHRRGRPDGRPEGGSLLRVSFGGTPARAAGDVRAKPHLLIRARQ